MSLITASPQMAGMCSPLGASAEDKNNIIAHRVMQHYVSTFELKKSHKTVFDWKIHENQFDSVYVVSCILDYGSFTLVNKSKNTVCEKWKVYCIRDKNRDIYQVSRKKPLTKHGKITERWVRLYAKRIIRTYHEAIKIPSLDRAIAYIKTYEHIPLRVFWVLFKSVFPYELIRNIGYFIWGNSQNVFQKLVEFDKWVANAG